ncbi:MAG: T9SS type A sorting domain-containing protein [Bacteroidota bacterium]
MKTVTKIMRTLPILSVGVLVLLLMGSFEAFAQRTVQVSQGFGTLNQAISSDTTETGERVDSNTVYVLSSGGLYLLDGAIEHRDYHLTIVAEDGYTERPRLIPAVPTGGSSDRAFRPRGDLTLRGLFFTNENEFGTRDELRIIRMSANDMTVIVDDCIMTGDNQSGFRVDGSGSRIFITNSIVSNIGITSDPNNGRGIDDRGNPIHTVYFENSTFYNLTSQALRDQGDIIERVYVNQNTFVNTGRFQVLEMGQVANATVTNNIFYNTTILGDDEEALSQISMLPLNEEQIAEFGEQTATIRWNNFFVDPAILDAYPDTVFAPVNFDSLTATFVSAADSATMLNEDIQFTNGPATPTDVVTAWWADQSGDIPPYDTEDEGESFDFSYPGTQASATAAGDGGELGARTWFGVLTSNEEEESGSLTTPTSFELLGNYPNPFNPTTNIAFSLPEASVVSVEVFNIVGQRVMTIPAQRFTAGANQNINIDASSLSSGIYLYRISARSATNTMLQTGRMTLIK